MENKTLRDSAAIRWTALLLLALAMFCAYIFVDILSRSKTSCSRSAAGILTPSAPCRSSETFLNVFIFFLIFAGIILRQDGCPLHGPSLWWRDAGGRLHQVVRCQRQLHRQRPGAWFTNNLNHIPVFEQLGVSPFYEGMPASAKLAAIGFMLFGCGTEMAGITVSRGIVKWFKGREMALAMGSRWHWPVSVWPPV